MAALEEGSVVLAEEQIPELGYCDLNEVPGELTGRFLKTGFNSGKYQERSFCLRSGTLCYGKYQRMMYRMTPDYHVVPVDGLTIVTEQRAGSLPDPLAFSDDSLALKVLPHDGLAVNLPNRDGGRRVYYLCSPNAKLRDQWKCALERLAEEKNYEFGVVLPWEVFYAQGFRQRLPQVPYVQGQLFRLDKDEAPGTNDDVYVEAWRKTSAPGKTLQVGQYPCGPRIKLYANSPEDRTGTEQMYTKVMYMIPDGAFMSRNEFKPIPGYLLKSVDTRPVAR